MLKNSKSNNHIDLNQNFQFPTHDKSNENYQNNKQNNYQKKKIKMIKSYSIINQKESEIINNKYSLKNKYNRIDKINEKKEKNDNCINIVKELKSNKYIKNNSISKENKNILNYYNGRKNSLPKQISFASKISNDELPTTIDNENNENKNKDNKKGIINNQSRYQNNRLILNNKKNNLYDYQIKELKQLLIKKQNIKNNIEIILSSKLKNKSNSNRKNNFSNVSKNKNKNHLIKNNIVSFSPIEKNNNFKKCSQSKYNIFSNTNPNINIEANNNNSNSQKSFNKSKNTLNKKNIEEDDNKRISHNKLLKKKMTEKSCPILNIDSSKIKNFKDSNINKENIYKNISVSNIILRNTIGPNLNNAKGALKPFCSLKNVPTNNKERKDNNDKTNSNYSISNENNYYFDKNKYFIEFKNRIKLNINNLFFNKSKRQQWKNLNDNKSKNTYINKNDNYFIENINNYESKNDNNINSEKLKNINNLLTEKINEIKNDKIAKIKKIKSKNIINKTNKNNSEKEKDMLILNDLYLKKRNTRKKSSDNIESNIFNLTNSSNLIYTKTNNKNSFTSFNRRSFNENNNCKNNYNSYFINVNNINIKGRNDNNILNNNFFEPQTTVYQKNHFYKNRINNNTYTNSNRYNYSHKMEKDEKSLTIFRNQKDKKGNKSVISSRRNKNIDNEIFNNDNNDINYLKLIKLFDELRKYKKTMKEKKKDLEICFLNNSNNNNSNNNMFNNFDIKNKKNKNKNKKIEVDENKIKENIVQNTLTMYTIYILSQYYPKCKKVGLMKISVLDKNGNNIPVICYNTNYTSYNKQNLSNYSLFNSTIRNNYPLNKNINKNTPFLMDFKKNLYINFYIKKIKSNYINCIQIINYCDVENDVSSVKNIQIFKGNHLIYKGYLSDKNIINKISLNTDINNQIYSSMLKQSNKNININNIKQRPLSSSKPRSCNNILITKSSTYRKSDVNEYYTKRNIFNKSNRKNYFSNDNCHENIKYIDKINKAFIYRAKKHSASNIRKTKLLNGFLGQELNISNTYTINNISNYRQKTYYGKGEQIIINDDISGNKNKNREQRLFYNLIKNKNKIDFNLKKNSKSYNQNKKKSNIINEYDNNIKRNNQKILMKSNSEKKYKKSIIKTQKSLLFQKINEEKDNDLNFNNFINCTYLNYSYKNPYNNGLYRKIIKNSNINKKYIEFNKIQFVLTSNYGHNKYIGLTGMIFYNLKGDPINIETASSIGALPKDLKTILDDNNENRIFENVFNNNNNTNEPENMWVTKFKKTPPLTFIEIYFQERIRLSRIKIYNYNEKNKLDIGVKTIDIYLDDEFYRTFFINKGIGETVNDFIINNDNNTNSDDFDKYKNNDFGQNFTFPFIEEEKYRKSQNYKSNYEFNKNNNSSYIKLLNNNIKYASFLYEQSYETPYLPYGYYIQFQFCSNYYKGISQKEEFGALKYNDIGLDNIEIYDNEGINILKNNSNLKNKYKLLSNCEINHNENNKIILNVENGNYNNSIFYVFERGIQISYIKFYPLTTIENGKKIKSFYSLKEVKIFCESNIIFEGDLYFENPTIVLFSCDTKIINNVNENYLTKNIKRREYEEIFKEDYISLILN